MPPSTSPFTEGSCSANGFACQHVPHPSRGEHERSTRKDGAVCSSDPDGEDVTRSSNARATVPNDDYETTPIDAITLPKRCSSC
ncbi:hypothetical protein SNOG_01520 [Parastagonospora nodorum SN15]|uniref:Uncharacterized protein n=1 Tax=Phaeosphaeria nodorum (strain SN15 / ATCC MYA-4574 / FGSC 10173) TaxID=321614 RepID=Q0V394_PHANO|nr:hypothetical protein SNOG_01520 [Parastagonospora nodorum SN15]EAT91169.1 hypothetical protein SNOG_01520 [Parastagonospora nodorum SN15]